MRKTILWLFMPLSLLVGLSLAIPFNGDPEEEKRKPENAVKNLKVADGLQAQLFASEPVMTNPTNIDIDDRGRVWVCEAYNYRPEINGNPIKKEGDRILILEDTNGDGAADKHTVFYQGPEIESPLGIWVMGNRAIVSQSPYLWLFTDDNGDDRADRKEVILQGIGGKQHDHGLHAVVFGPDGKLYFNFGNDGKTLQDKNGQTIKNREGTEISLKNYKQGMVFRCDPDFTNFEVLGHNFRNNYEVALDSYGTMWQSDNDDDGNKGVRINYVMEFGNYGYTDEMTGAGWQVNRTNLEAEIPLRHWHLNDPGVVPNLLQTGAGSPCGMNVYEGTLLPEVFRGQPIHADAGPNVVRAYVKTNDGAGYKAQIVNILEGVGDQWFRPCDVCVAPDGSLFAADWYDPGVGGHNAGDQNRGRIFRVAPPSAAAYKVPTFDYSTPESALAALRNPNLSVRWKAWQALHKMGATAEAALTQVANNDPAPEQRARALWLLVKGTNGAAHVQRAATDADPNIRMVAIRAARQGAAPLMPLLTQLAKDPDPQVRRECALALHHNNAPEVAAIWTTLARQHNGRDRWYLEALGIAAADQWDRCFAAWLQAVGDQATATAANHDIVWRARCAAAAPLLGKLASDAKTALSARLRYFRAFDFIKDASKSAVLLQLVRDNSAQPDVVKLALRHLDADFVKTNPEAKTALLGLMKHLQGAEYIEFAERYMLPEENARLYNMAVKGDYANKAADILLRDPAGLAMLTQTLKNKKQDEEGIALLKALSRNGGKVQLDLIKAAAFDKKRSEVFRKKAFEYLGGSWGGENLVLDLLRNNSIDKKFIPAAVQGVSNAWRLPVRLESQKYLGKSTADAKMPDVATLSKLKGDVASGMKLFETNCANCHVVNGQGIDYGPNLSEIGSKLSREAQYLAILHPSAGISFGYEGWNIKLKDGSLITGIIASQTEMEMVVKMPGGGTQTYSMKDVVSKKQIEQSLMPEGFHIAMNEGQLVDLVEYMKSLKRK